MTSDATAEIVNPQAMFGGALPTSPIIAYDVRFYAGFQGRQCARCVAAWNEKTARYEFIDVEH